MEVVEVFALCAVVVAHTDSADVAANNALVTVCVADGGQVVDIVKRQRAILVVLVTVVNELCC